MKSQNPWMRIAQTVTTRVVVGLLVVGLAGAPELLAQTAQSTTPPPQTTQAPDATQQNGQWQSNRPLPPANQQNPGIVPDPSKGPLQPVPSTQPELPNAPSAQPNAQPQTVTNGASDQPTTQQQPREAPLGAAAAETARTTGGLASKPAGTAIAPAKQRQVRSMLIRMGAIGAGAAALGIVYALSRGTSSTPPGVGSASTLGH